MPRERGADPPLVAKTYTPAGYGWTLPTHFVPYPDPFFGDW
jgi:hypothetical protein